MSIRSRIKSGRDAKEELRKGINIVSDAVRSTMGAEGKVVLMESGLDLMPHPTKDGVTVATSIYGTNSFEELGVKIIKNATQRTMREEGDGTTQTAVLTQSIINQGLDLENFSHIKLNSEIRDAQVLIEKELLKLKGEISSKTKQHIATVSVNGDKELGTIIADLYNELGDDVAISVKEGAGLKTVVSKMSGIVLERGMALPYFADKDSNIANFTGKVNLLVVRGDIAEIKQVDVAVSEALQRGEPLVVVCDDISEQAMRVFVKLRIDSNRRIVIVIAPDQGNGKKELLIDDLCLATGSKPLDLKSGSKDFKFGILKESIIDLNKTVLLPLEFPQEIEDRITELKESLDGASELDKNFILKRISNLRASTAEIVVGGKTDLEIKEKKDRVDDAVLAVKSAIKSGYVAGGGTALYCVAQKLDKRIKTEGGRILLNAIRRPFLQILENASYEPPQKIKYRYGIDVVSRKKVNLIDKGIIDSLGVLLAALRNSISVATLVFSTDYLILHEDDSSPLPQ